jgi:outer membrane protein TolC
VTSEQIDKEDVAVRAAEAYLDIAMARYETGLGPIPECHHPQNILLSNQQSLVTLRVSEMAAAVS